MRKCVGAVDIGGTKIWAALVDYRGEILEEIKLPTQAQDGAMEVVERIADALRHLWREKKFDCDLYGLGIAVAGSVHPQTEMVGLAPNLGWRNFPLKDYLAEIFSLPVVMDNDANCGALGEYHYGAGKGKHNLLYVTVSTGIGSGWLVNGQPVRGASGAAGELGHWVMQREGRYCSCGRRGCLETLASGQAIARYAQELIAAGGGQKIRELADLPTAQTVNQAAALGDSEAQNILNQAADYLVQALDQAILFTDPDLVLLGGGALQKEGFYWQLIQEKLTVKTGFPELALVEAKSCLLGAAALAWQKFSLESK